MLERMRKRLFATWVAFIPAAFLPLAAAAQGPQPPATNGAGAAVPAATCSAHGHSDTSALTAEEIVARMGEANQQRAALLQGYVATRNYHAENLRWKKSADLQATVKFISPATKQFTVVKESGAGIIRRMVFRGMMNAEADALTPQMKRRTEINPSNYRFRLVEEETVEGQRTYVLAVEPVRTDKYLFRGRIWVDACDFAIARLHGRPAKSPSFWTRKVEYEKTYQKVGEFWLPRRENATSEIRIFGKSVAAVEHTDYQIESAPAKP